MYNYHIIHKDNSGRIGLSPSLKSLKALKENYFHRLEKSKREIFSVNGNVWSRKTNKENVAYLIVNKGNKLHGYYTADFVKDDGIELEILLGLTKEPYPREDERLVLTNWITLSTSEIWCAYWYSENITTLIMWEYSKWK